MWDGKTKAQLKSAKLLLVIILVFLTTLVLAGIGIDNSDSNYYRVFNNDANYWIAKQGFQISNTPSQHQANMEVCYELKCGGFTIPKKCVDSMAWNWLEDTDNLTYSHLTAYTTINPIGSNYIDFNILYALDSPDQNRIFIQPLIRNRTSYNCDFNLFYKTTDINIALDKNGDWLTYWKDGEKGYDLNNLNLAANNLDVNRFRIFDIVAQNDMILWFDSIFVKDDVNYIANPIIIAQPEAGQLFSPVDLKILFGVVLKNTTIKYNLWWKDAKVPTAVTLMHPDINASYDLNTNISADCFVTIGGTGGAGDYVGSLEDCNNTACTALQNMTTNQSNQVLTIIQGDANPISTSTTNVDLNWTLTGNSAGTRYVRCKVDSNNTTGCRAAAPCYSTIRQIKINAPPDVNVVKIDSYDDNKALPIFDYYADGNITIDFNVYDDYNGVFFGSGGLDANIDARDVNGNSFRIITDLNLMARASVGSNKGRYCDDLNFSNKDKNIGTTCHWDWNIALITDRNVFIDINVTDSIVTDRNSSDYNFRIDNVLPAARSTSALSTAYGNQRKIIRNRDGNRLYVVYTDNNVFFTQSDDNGATWTAPIDITGFNPFIGAGEPRKNAQMPSIDINSNGGLLVSYVADNPQNIPRVYFVSCHIDCNVKANWSLPTLLKIVDFSPLSPVPQSMNIDNDDNIHIFHVNTFDSSLTYTKCAGNADCDRNVNWEVPIIISGTFDVKNNASAISGDKNLHVVFSRSLQFTSQIMYDWCNLDKNCSQTANWHTDTNVSGDFNNNDGIQSTAIDYPVIAIDNSDALNIAWQQNTDGNRKKRDYEIIYKRCANSCGVSAAWEADINISNSAGNDDKWASIAYTSDNNIYVFWDTNSLHGNGDIAYKKRTSGGVWDANFNPITNNNRGNHYPNLRIRSQTLSTSTHNYLDYVWTEGTASLYNVRYDMNNLGYPISIPPSNQVVDVNIVRPNGGEIIGVRDGNYRIDFNVSDKDCNGIFWCGGGRLDANIDYNIAGGWIRIVTDLNLMATASVGSNKGIYCDDLNFAGSKDQNKQVTCHYDWNLAVWREPSVDSRVDVNVTDNNGSSDTNRSGNFFRLHNWLISSSTTATAYNNSRKLVRNADGNRIYLVYEANLQTSTSNEIWFAQSDDNGSTWSTPANVSDTNNRSSTSPAIDINSTGGLQVVWIEEILANGYAVAYKSCSADCNNKSNWSSKVNLTADFGSGFIGRTAIDINSTNGLHVVYWVSSLGKFDIYYRSCSGDCGISGKWVSALNVSNNLNNSKNSALDINSTDGISLVWDDKNNVSGIYEILYKSCSGDCGTAGNWSSDVNISSNSGDSNFPAIAISNDNKVHAAWTDYTSVPDGGVRYRNCSSNCGASASWGNDFNVNDANGQYPSIAFDTDNNVYVVWMDDNALGSRDNINTRKRQSGGAWDANVIKTTDGNDNQYPNARKNTVAGTSDYWDYAYTKGLAADFNIVFASEVLKAGAAPPAPANNSADVNLNAIENNYAVFPPFSYFRDGNLTIDFNVSDIDMNGKGRIDANIDYRDANGTITRLITDLNLMVAGRCDDINFTNSTKCSWDFNIMLITDRNTFIDINITDNNGSTDANSIARSIMIDNNRPAIFTTAGKATIRKQAREVLNGDFNEHTKGALDYNVLIQDATSGLAPYDLNIYHKVAIDGNAESRWKYNMISITGTAGWQPEWHIADFNEITNLGSGDYNVNFSLDADHDYRAGVLPIDIPTWNSYTPSSFTYGDISKQKFWIIGMEGIDVDKNMEYHLGINMRETDGTATNGVNFYMCDWNYFDTNGDFRKSTSCRFISSVLETALTPAPDFNEFEGLFKINDVNAFNGLVMRGRMVFGIECFACANTNAGWSFRYNATNNSRNIWNSANKGTSYSNVDAVPDFHLHWFNLLKTARLVIRTQAEDKAGNDVNSIDKNYVYAGVEEAPNIHIDNPIDQIYSGTIDINGSCNDPDGDPLLIDVNLMDLNFGFNRILADRNVSCVAGNWALTFNTLAVPDGNYWIDVNAYDGLQYTGDRSDFNFGILNISNNAVDINLIAIDGNYLPFRPYSYARDKNLTIDFNVSDLDVNGIGRIDANIDYRDTNGTITRIITDLNLMVSGRCDDINFTNSTKCSWDLNIIYFTDRNIFIDINVTDNSGSTDLNSIARSFMIDNTKPFTYSTDINRVWKNTDQNLHFTCFDSSSGCSITKFKLDTDSNVGVNFFDWNVYDKNIFIDKDGNWAIDINSTDNAGNIEDTNRIYLLIDKTAPYVEGYEPFLDTNQLDFFVFAIIPKDANAGVRICDYNIYKNFVFYKSGTTTPTPSTGECIYTDSNLVSNDMMFIAWRVWDDANNFFDFNSPTRTLSPGISHAPDSGTEVGGGAGIVGLFTQQQIMFIDNTLKAFPYTCSRYYYDNNFTVLLNAFQTGGIPISEMDLYAWLINLDKYKLLTFEYAKEQSILMSGRDENVFIYNNILGFSPKLVNVIVSDVNVFLNRGEEKIYKISLYNKSNKAIPLNVKIENSLKDYIVWDNRIDEIGITNPTNLLFRVKTIDNIDKVSGYVILELGCKEEIMGFKINLLKKEDNLLFWIFVFMVVAVVVICVVYLYYRKKYRQVYT